MARLAELFMLSFSMTLAGCGSDGEVTGKYSLVKLVEINQVGVATE